MKKNLFAFFQTKIGRMSKADTEVTASPSAAEYESYRIVNFQNAPISMSK